MYNGAYAAPLVLDTVFVDNEASGDGGAMANEDDAMPYVRGVVFANNTAKDGGAIHNRSATSYVRDSVFVANQANGDGGGIMNGNQGYADVDGCLFSDNVGSSEGGAIIDWSNYAGTYIANSIFASNYSPNGSGMSVWDGASPQVRNCVFAGNTTAGRGGAIYGGWASLSVLNSTLVANVSTSTSAAIELDSGPLVMANTLLWNNDPTDVLVDQDVTTNILTHSIYGGTDPSLVGIVASGTWSNAAAYDGQELQTTLTDGSANWEPAGLVGMFVRPVETGTRFLPIIANSTQEVTVWGDLSGIIAAGTSYQVWDFRLSGSSPGMDCADAAYAPIYDLDRNPRVDIFTVSNDGAGEPPFVDMGAYEYQEDEPSTDQWSVAGCSAVTALQDSGHLYFFCASASSWADARAFCRLHGLHLATIGTADEQRLVTGLSSLRTWVGGYNGDLATRWVWETGDPLEYTNWGTGQPGSAANRCLQLDNAGNWESTNCSSTDAFVCEYSP
jgi:predicted outer membrane repeat protein